MSTPVTIDLIPNEIILSTSGIRFTLPRGADASDLARYVDVPGVDGQIRGSRQRNTFRWSAVKGLTPGRHQFVVDALTTKRSKKISEPIEIPFMVVDTAAKVSSKHRIESFSRVSIDNQGRTTRYSMVDKPDGAYIEYFKTVHRETGALTEMAFDQDGKRLDSDELLADFYKRNYGRTGKLDPLVAKMARDVGGSGRIMIDVWLDIDAADLGAMDRPTDDGGFKRARQQAQELRKDWYARGKEFAASLADAKILHVDALAPMVVVEVEASSIRSLANNDRVARIMLHEVDGIEDLDDSIAIARSGVVHSAGDTGAGVNVAVWEDGPTSNSDLVIAGRFRTNPSTSNHSQNVHAIVRNSETGSPNGHAPGCDLFSANSKNRSALTWAVEDEECTVINQSFHRSSEPGSDSLSSDDLYGDWLALHWPYPLIVHAAGNFWNGDSDNINPPSSEYVNHKGYNTISVGNHNDDATAMRGSSVFRNPSSPHGDRELPEICANGTSVTADGITMTGTSQASPAVVGAAALLQERSPTLAHWPEGCRAILAAGANRNVSDDSWWQDVAFGVDASDGAGALDARESHLIAGHRRFRGAPGSRRGWDIGRLTSDDFASDKRSRFAYHVSVPDHWWGPKNVRVVIAWTSEVTKLSLPIFPDFFFSNLKVDLDLMVYDSRGRLVGYSGSWDNSYEIAEFVGAPGETYSIRIRRWSGDTPTWYGIAWTVTGGLRFEMPVEIAYAALARR